MPRFTLIKHPENDFDSEVTVTFDTDSLGVAREHFTDFVKASGFEVPLETDPSPIRIDRTDFLAKEDDWLWDDAFYAKFRNDGVEGSEGTDNIIKFPTSEK